ncbi:NAD(+) diphosphatase [Treponema sp.]|uniref:NAD(+) diphosphatase n=1 Tax=Treponema sp. TaxID=166 RepID=UPI00388E4741
MPIHTKPANFIYKHNIAIKGTDLLLTTEGNLPTSKNMESLCSIALDWFSEDLYGYTALLLKNDAEIPDNFTLCPIRRFFYERKELVFIAARAKSLLSQRQMYRFCPTCGDRLLDDTTESALFCPTCKIKFFPRIEPATITLISRGDEILLARGKRGPYKKFACISGFVEQGETLEECVAREVKEETNLDIKNIKYMGSTAWPFPDQLMLEFTADYAGGELKIQEDELEEARWFRRDQLPPPEDLPQPGSSAWNLIFGNANK